MHNVHFIHVRNSTRLHVHVAARSYDNSVVTYNIQPYEVISRLLYSVILTYLETHTAAP